MAVDCVLRVAEDCKKYVPRLPRPFHHHIHLAASSISSGSSKCKEPEGAARHPQIKPIRLARAT
eukprot:6973369-Pyramimonas_sp.AAC.2